MNSMAVLAVAWKLDKMGISKLFHGLNPASRGFVAFVVVRVVGKRAREDLLIILAVNLQPWHHYCLLGAQFLTQSC